MKLSFPQDKLRILSAFIRLAVEILKQFENFYCVSLVQWSNMS